MWRLILCLAAALTLAGCAAEPKWSSDAVVTQAAYRAPGPPTITLFTVVGSHRNQGAHSGLLINGSQRVMFDPAGSWQHPRIPERNDVHFGMTDKMVAFYIDYHARETYNVVEQTLVVTPEQAEAALRAALNYGAVKKSYCTVATSSVLRSVPGLESIDKTWFPKQVMKQFGEIPGVTTRTITDNDADKNHGVLLVQAQDGP